LFIFSFKYTSIFQKKTFQSLKSCSNDWWFRRNQFYNKRKIPSCRKIRHFIVELLKRRINFFFFIYINKIKDSKRFGLSHKKGKKNS
jgi:hypothetical protein